MLMVQVKLDLNFCIARGLQFTIDNLGNPGWENNRSDDSGGDAVEVRCLQMRKSEVVGEHRDTNNINQPGDHLAYHHSPVPGRDFNSYHEKLSEDQASVAHQD